MSYAKRNLNVAFRLGEGEFSSGGNTAQLPDGLRIKADVIMAGDSSMTELKLQVYGMPLELMNRLTVLGGGGGAQSIVTGRLNSVLLQASSSDAPTPSTVFVGTINQAWADLNSPPDGVFQVSALTGPIDGLRSITPTSYDGSVDVATAIQSIATQMGHLFENNGVTGQIPKPYLSGTGRDQIQSLVDAARIHWVVDGNTVAIWPLNGSRKGDPILISPDHGMVGYPIWTQGGMIVRTLYNPNFVFGSRVQVQSDIKPATGIWTIYRMTHELDSQLPDGRWYTTLEANLAFHEGSFDLGGG